MTLEFLLVSLLVVASPGTGATFTIATGLSQGARAACVAALGCTLGILTHILATVTGLAALLQTSGPTFELLKVAGVGYLLYLAWGTWREQGVLSITPDGRPHSDAEVIRQAIWVNLLNPKLSMFFLAFLPQFISASDQSPTLTLLELSAAFMAETLLVFAVYGAFAARLRERLLQSPTAMAWLRRAFAASHVGLGIKLGLTER